LVNEGLGPLILLVAVGLIQLPHRHLPSSHDGNGNEGGHFRFLQSSYDLQLGGAILLPCDSI